MKCKKCSNKMKLAQVYDDPQQEPLIGWNLFVCDGCGVICRENVWSSPGRLWVFTDNTTLMEPRPADAA